MAVRASEDLGTVEAFPLLCELDCEIQEMEERTRWDR